MPDHGLADERANHRRPFGFHGLGDQLDHPAVDSHADARAAVVLEQLAVQKLDDGGKKTFVSADRKHTRAPMKVRMAARRTMDVRRVPSGITSQRAVSNRCERSSS